MKSKLLISAAESDRGGYGVGWMFIKHNRFYQIESNDQCSMDK